MTIHNKNCILIINNDQIVETFQENILFLVSKSTQSQSQIRKPKKNQLNRRRIQQNLHEIELLTSFSVVKIVSVLKKIFPL